VLPVYLQRWNLPWNGCRDPVEVLESGGASPRTGRLHARHPSVAAPPSDPVSAGPAGGEQCVEKTAPPAPPPAGPGHGRRGRRGDNGRGRDDRLASVNGLRR